MKKVLFATTALVMTAGVAAAEVTVGGNGRMGIHYDSDNWNFTSRIRIVFTASGETDGGLSFGGSIRADNSGSGAVGSAGSVYISGAFGKISMGDVDGAAENAVGDVSGVGLTGLGDYNETMYVHGGAADNDPVMLYEYSAGDLSLYLSATDGAGNTLTGTGIGSHIAQAQSYGIGVKYSMGDYTVGLGYETVDGGDEQILIGGSAKFGDATVKAMYGSADIMGDQYALSLDYSFGATTVTAFVHDADTFGSAIYGLGASYDLGGGASVKGGLVDCNTCAGTIADLGVSFTF